MNTKDQLDRLLADAADKTPPVDPEQLWRQIANKLDHPADERVSFRQLRNVGIAALLLVLFNIWLCMELMPGQQQPAHTMQRDSYNLNIY